MRVFLFCLWIISADILSIIFHCKFCRFQSLSCFFYIRIRLKCADVLNLKHFHVEKSVHREHFNLSSIEQEFQVTTKYKTRTHLKEEFIQSRTTRRFRCRGALVQSRPPSAPPENVRPPALGRLPQNGVAHCHSPSRNTTTARSTQSP